MVTWSPGTAARPVPTMRSALSRWAGGGPVGMVSVGGCPAVPAGDRSAAGMGTMASSALLPGTVVLVVVEEELATADVFDEGEELQAASTSAPTAARATRARTRRCGRGNDMGCDGSPWPPPATGTGRHPR